MSAAKASKYKNKRVVIGGVKHASQKQGLRWILLRQWERDGKISGLRREVPFDLVVNGQKVCRYIADHVYYEAITSGVTCYFSAKPTVEDVKGFKTDVYKLKKKLMLACHGIEIREV